LIFRTTEVIDALERILLDERVTNHDDFNEKHSLLITYQILLDCGFSSVSITDAHLNLNTN